jgi:hypothetical protein
MECICMDCKKHLGWKCQNCGSTDIRVFCPPDEYAQTPGTMKCNACSVLFMRTGAGRTHGLCSDCLHDRTPNLFK